MPDISMCEDHTCPDRMTCYRYRAVPTPNRQSYFYGPVREPGEDGCEYYMRVWRTSEARLVPESELPK